MPYTPSGKLTPSGSLTPSSSAYPITAPVEGMIVGVCASDWGGNTSFGPSGGLTMAQDIKRNLCDYVRWDMTLTESDWQQYYLSQGLRRLVVFPGDNALGWGYNTGGVQSLNATDWATAALNWYQRWCEPADTPAIEILNEPWGTWFWGTNANTQANAEAYGALIKAVWNVFSGYYGTNGPKILGNTFGGPSPGNPVGTLTDWWNWLIAAHPDIAEYYDGVILHPYGGGTGVDTTLSRQGSRNAILTAVTATGKRAWCTEFGWPTDTGGANTGDSQQQTEAQQATCITDFLAWARSSNVVDAAFYYHYMDESAPAWYGLVRYGEGGVTVDYSHKPAFNALSQKTISPIFLTGFEPGLVSTQGGAIVTGTSGSGGYTIQGSGAQRSGNYCMRIANAGPSTSTYVYWDTATLTSKAVLRFAIKVSSRPSSGSANICWVYPAAGGNAVGMCVHSDGTLGVYLYAAGTNEVTGVAIDTTNWHVIEMQLDCTTTTWTVDWKVDGIAQTRWTMSSMTATNWYEFGIGAGIASSAFTADYDDVILGSWVNAVSDWWGNGKILPQLAGSDGTHSTVTQFSPGDAGTAYSGTVTNAYTMVDDPTPWTEARSTTDSIAQRTAGSGYMEIAPAAATVGGRVANAVSAVMAYSANSTTADNAACVVRNSEGTTTTLWGSSTSLGSSSTSLADYSETSNYFKRAIIAEPTVGWAASEVNALRWRFGGSSDISPPPTVQAFMLEVDWPWGIDLGELSAVGLSSSSLSLIIGAATAIAPSATDLFNRADGSLGSSWTDNTEGALSIMSQTVGGTNASTSTTLGNVRTGTWGNDHSSQVEVATSPGGSYWYGPVVRAQNGGADCYLMIYFNNGGSYELRLYKRQSNTFTQLGTTYNCGLLAAGTKLKLAAVGSTITCYQDSTAVISVQDTSITGGGGPGIYAVGNTGTVDNWSGQSILLTTGTSLGSGVVGAGPGLGSLLTTSVSLANGVVSSKIPLGTITTASTSLAIGTLAAVIKGTTAGTSLGIGAVTIPTGGYLGTLAAASYGVTPDISLVVGTKLAPAVSVSISLGSIALSAKVTIGTLLAASVSVGSATVSYGTAGTFLGALLTTGTSLGSNRVTARAILGTLSGAGTSYLTGGLVILGTLPPTESAWRYVITDMSGFAAIGNGQIQNPGSRTWSYMLNGGRTAACVVKADNPIVDYVLTHDCLMKVYRRSRTGAWARMLVGDVIQVDEAADDSTDSVQIVAADPWWRLQRRLVGMGVDSAGKGTGYSDGTVSAQKDLCQILMGIINNLNATYNTGIVAGSAGTSTNGYIGPVYATKVGELFQQISSTLGGPDWEIVPQEPYNGAMPYTIIGVFNTGMLGQLRSNTVFEYGTGKYNVSSYGRVTTKDGQANQIYGLPQGWPDAPATGDSVVISQDGASYLSVGLLQDIVGSDLASVKLRQELCDEHLAVRKYAKQQVTFVPRPDCEYEYGADFVVGDVVIARAVVGNSYRLNGSVRVYGVSFAISDDDSESMSLTLIPGST